MKQSTATYANPRPTSQRHFLVSNFSSVFPEVPGLDSNTSLKKYARISYEAVKSGGIRSKT